MNEFAIGAIKNLIVRCKEGFKQPLEPNGFFVEMMLEYEDCVESVMEFGPWPKPGKGELLARMSFAEPGETKAGYPTF
jgi:hypothetical protein